MLIHIIFGYVFLTHSSTTSFEPVLIIFILLLHSEYEATAHVYLERRRLIPPVDYSFATLRRDSIDIKIERMTHLRYSVNLLNERIGPEDLTEDEISEVIDILLDSEERQEEVEEEIRLPMLKNVDPHASTAETTSTSTRIGTVNRENDSSHESNHSG